MKNFTRRGIILFKQILILKISIYHKAKIAKFKIGI